MELFDGWGREIQVTNYFYVVTDKQVPSLKLEV